MCPGHSVSAACHMGMAAPGSPVTESPGTAIHWSQLPLGTGYRGQDGEEEEKLGGGRGKEGQGRGGGGGGPQLSPAQAVKPLPSHFCTLTWPRTRHAAGAQ